MTFKGYGNTVPLGKGSEYDRRVELVITKIWNCLINLNVNFDIVEQTQKSFLGYVYIVNQGKNKLYRLFFHFKQGTAKFAG
jgi:hypothetical protein